jgi:hypothetical protein
VNRTGEPAAINVLPSEPVMFSITTAVTVRPTVSVRELIESSRAAWISVPIGRVRAAVVDVSIGAGAGVGTEVGVGTEAGAGLGAGARLARARPLLIVVSGTAVEVSSSSLEAVSGAFAVANSVADTVAVSPLASALSRLIDDAVSTAAAFVEEPGAGEAAESAAG